MNSEIGENRVGNNREEFERVDRFQWYFERVELIDDDPIVEVDFLVDRMFSMEIEDLISEISSIKLSDLLQNSRFFQSNHNQSNKPHIVE